MGESTHIWELQSTLAVYTTFKTESNAIEFAKGRARPHGCRLASVAQLERSTWQVLKSTALDAVNDHGSWLSYIGVGIRAFFSAQGPGLSSKCSKEVLDRQLVSAVLRSSVRYCCTLACMSCSCRLITSRSVTLARASTRMRRLLMQQQAVRMSLQSCSLITPAREFRLLQYGVGVFQSSESVRQSVHIVLQ